VSVCEWERVCMCECVSERESVCECVSVCIPGVCGSVCMSYMCVCMYAYVCICM